jgi:molybdopterin synthase catalytic subunit
VKETASCSSHRSQVADMFRIVPETIDSKDCRNHLLSRSSGACVVFEGWVRDHNEGREVASLEYEAYEALATKEGRRILAEAIERFPIEAAYAEHRVGHLAIGDVAVWVGVSSAHRSEAFEACRFIIDQIKHRVPIWKREHYVDGTAEWVDCTRCAQHDEPAGAF